MIGSFKLKKILVLVLAVIQKKVVRLPRRAGKTSIVLLMARIWSLLRLAPVVVLVLGLARSLPRNLAKKIF